MPVAKKRAVKRGRGRPPKEENGERSTIAILDAAIKLFSLQGVQSTSMSQIAKEAGYDQSSLYYWFKSKEDILTAILKDDETTQSLQYAIRIAAKPGDKHVQLYAVLYTDMIMLCASPFDYYDLELVALSSDEFLQPFFNTHQQLSDVVAAIIRDGIEEKVFSPCDPVITALDALALNEGLQHRFHMVTHGVFSDDEEAKVRWPLGQKEELAHHVASKTLLDVDPACNPDSIREAAIADELI